MTAAIQTYKPEALAFLHSVDANVGSAEANQRTPMLTVVRNPQRCELEQEGTFAKKGQIYHTELKQAWDSVEVHVVATRMTELYIDWDQEQNDWNRAGQMKNHLLVGGFLLPDYVPFIYKIRGMNWSQWIPFEKTLKPLRKEHIPMFAVTVEMSTKEESNTQGGSAFVIVPTMKLFHGQPVIEEDVSKLKMMLESVNGFQKQMHDLELRNLTKNAKAQVITSVEASTAADDFEQSITDTIIDVEDINGEIPF